MSSQGITALDVTDPASPSELWSTTDYSVHGVSFNPAGDRLYAADLSGETGVIVLDVSQVQDRAADPQVPEVSRLDWPERSIPQNTVHVTFGGREHLVEFDEYSREVFAYDPASPVGAARIIDISDETRTARRQHHAPGGAPAEQPRRRAGRRPGRAAGRAGVRRPLLRRADDDRPDGAGVQHDPVRPAGVRHQRLAAPRETAYFNRPAPNGAPLLSGAYAMSAPSLDVERRLLHYSDGNSGFWTVRLTNGVWGSAAAPGPPSPVRRPGPARERRPRPSPRRPAGGRLPATGLTAATTSAAVLLLLLGAVLRRRAAAGR